jgi:hypothetical protein
MMWSITRATSFLGPKTSVDRKPEPAAVPEATKPTIARRQFELPAVDR